MQEDTAELLQLVGDIYDAALDPGLWPGVMAEIADFIPVAAVNLFSEDTLAKTARVFFSHGIDAEYHALYLDKYIHLNPMFPATLFFEVGRVLTESDIIPQAEFRASRFYKEWLRPQGLIEMMAAILDKSSTSVAALAVARGEKHGSVDDEAIARMGLLVPHVRRAVAIGKVIELHKIEAATMGDALDGLAAAAILLDAESRIVHLNASAGAMLSDGTVLRGGGSRLSAVDAPSDQALREALAMAAAGDISAGTKGAAVPLRGAKGLRYVAHLLPLRSGARKKAGVAYSAVAALFVCKAAIDLSHPLEALASAFELTPAEMRVLMAVVQIGGVPQVAPVLGISETTVKTHLQRIFTKTGTSRQADLVKLAASFMSPLASSKN